ncbi:response regulator transcription factor [Paenibacillus thalictri]|uniref:Response regulator n=1 Tax=Paenibacillus thalictri TaxID=2527873 RepID=A0A4Q9DU44_9BACL|nr:response regulator [Paenibacillus thalictri]TBL79755.1 response regulator [Paenibacillus thalictri]
MAENRIDNEPIRVLIIDDEQLVRKGLMMTVDWNKHQMAVVADAANGSLGWDAFLLHRPHVVITDIVMPEMDGIELAQKIRKEQPDTIILFLSCHRDFAYAQQGIQIGISDYIVKTSLDDDQMDECLAKISGEIREKQRKAAMKPVSASREEDTILQQWLAENKPVAETELHLRLQHIWKWMTEQSYIFHLYVGTPESGEEQERGPLREWMHSVALAGPNMQLLTAGEDEAFLVCRSEHLEYCDLELTCLKLKHHSFAWRQAGPVTDSGKWLETVRRLHRYRGIELKYELQGGIHKEEILHAVDYIDQHLHMDLRAADIASKIGVSRSYFSTIFKEATGSSLISFISDRKLERAKELLKVTSFRSEEIAEKVGIADAKYFSKWFKKCVSLTPGQFRNQTK